MWTYHYNDELTHHGIKGQKWGKRRYQNADGTLTNAGKTRYRSTNLKAAMARRANEKVDKGFNDWKKNTDLRDTAIDLGKKATAARMAYESNKSDKALKSAYKEADKAYKKALRENTAYRQGVVRQEVGKDASRKYLSEAKKVKKQLDSDPSNKKLQKQYADLMSKHDIERADARRAKEVGTKRMNKVRTIKSRMTTTVKAVAGTAAVAAGAAAVGGYLKSHNVTVNGKPVNFSQQNMSDIVDVAGKIKNMFGYMY